MNPTLLIERFCDFVTYGFNPYATIFYESLKTEATKKAYRLWLEQFFEYAHEDYDSIIKLKPDRIKQVIKEYVTHKRQKLGVLNTRHATKQTSGYNIFILMTNHAKFNFEIKAT